MKRLQGQQGSEIQTLFEYDAMGRLVSTNTHHENPNPNTPSQSLIERNYIYDTIGQLTDISGSTQLVGGVGNNANNAHNTNSQDRYQRRHNYQYDSVGRLTRHKLTDFANSSGTEERFAFSQFAFRGMNEDKRRLSIVARSARRRAVLVALMVKQVCIIIALGIM